MNTDPIADMLTRIRNASAGRKPRVDVPDRKVTVVAQAEVAEGAVGVWEPEDETLLEATDEEEE